MTSIGTLVATITANATQFNREMRNAQGQVDETSGRATGAGKAIAIAFGVVAVAGAIKFIDVLSEMTEGAITTRKAFMGLEAVAKGYGQSAEEAKKASKTLADDGLMKINNSVKGLQNLIGSNFSVAEALEMSKALKDIGAFNNVVGDLGQAYEDSTKGIKTGSIELIENIGLTQKLSAVMKAANVDISNGIDITNNAAQRRALYNAVIAEGIKFEGNAAKLANDVAGSGERAAAAYKDMADAIGNRLMPVASGLSSTFVTLAENIKEVVEKSNFSKVTDDISNQRTKLSELTTLYLQLKDNTNKSNTEQELFLKTIEDLKKSYPDFLGKIDLQNIKTGTAVTLFNELNNQMERQYINQLKEAELKDIYIAKAELAKEEIEATKKVYNLRAKLQLQEEQGTNYIFKDITKEQLSKAETHLNGLKKGIKSLDDKILKVSDSWEQLGYVMDSTKKTSIYTKPDFLIKLEADVKKAQELAKGNGGKETTTKETKTKNTLPSLDLSETFAQKKAALDATLKVDLANAKEEEKWRVQLEYDKAIAIIKAQDTAEKKIEENKKKYEAGEKSKKAAEKDINKIKVDLIIETGNITKEFDENINGIQAWLDENPLVVDLSFKIDEEAARQAAQDAADQLIKNISKQEQAVGLTNPAEYRLGGGAAKEEAEYVNATIEDVIKSFNELATVLDNDIVDAVSNVIVGANGLKKGAGAFSAAQGAKDKLGMLSSGIGMFSSAVSIFQMVGGLFSKSTYNFDDAVKRMLENIGEKTPTGQVEEYNKAVKLKDELVKSGKITEEDYQNFINGSETLKMIIGSRFDKTTKELLTNLEKIIPQLAEQLGTAAADFGSDISSALSQATTFDQFSALLYDNVYDTVKTGLINAFLASEVMKPLLEGLSKSITIAVADGTLSDGSISAEDNELADLNNQVDKIKDVAKPFYDALEQVGFNVIDSADKLESASKNFSNNINRNLDLVRRINQITTPSASSALTGTTIEQVTIDLSNSNLGNNSVTEIKKTVKTAIEQSNIAKLGVK